MTRGSPKHLPSFCDFLLLLKRRPVGVQARSPEGRLAIIGMDGCAGRPATKFKTR